MPFDFQRLRIPEVVLVTPKIFPDDRGFFLEVYKDSDFKQYGIDKPFIQINHSKSQKGVLRGLHYQKEPMAQGKLVSVIQGEIFDVAVDIRPGSSTFGKWVGHTLTAQKHQMLYVPEGFAHGLLVLSDFTEVIYYCTNIYSPDHECGIKWDDPDIGIDWPEKKPILSRRDTENQPLK